MNRQAILIAVLSLSLLPTGQTQAKSDDNIGAPTIAVTKLDVNGDALNLAYEIRNDSKDDAWIYTGAYQSGAFGMSAGVFLNEDGHTLMISALFDRPTEVLTPTTVYGRFVRLGSGENQTESVFMEIPVHPVPQSGSVRQQEQDIRFASHLAIEIGYYPGNLPEMILESLETPENVFPVNSKGDFTVRDLDNFTSPDTFCSWNERVSSRDEELLIPTGWNKLRGVREHILRTVVDNVRVPYEVMPNRRVSYERPNLRSCTRVDFKFHPSMLDYFFPFAFQQNLMSSEELEYMQSEKNLILEDDKKIQLLANDINKASTRVTYGGALIERYRSFVNVICSYGSPMSFLVYNDNAIRIDGGVLPCLEGFPSLKKLTPQIQSIDLRVRCAANLKNQWYRLRFYNLAEAIRRNNPSIRNKTLYPTPSEWCDSILRPYLVRGALMFGGHSGESLVCPSAGEGKCHYAMNPNCRPNSPPDMVLLFETKAGWNQHGGPELFTFDNHDPKGGCVLLNDGTVKFIRTEEELHRLRWK